MITVERAKKRRSMIIPYVGYARQQFNKLTDIQKRNWIHLTMREMRELIINCELLSDVKTLLIGVLAGNKFLEKYNIKRGELDKYHPDRMELILHDCLRSMPDEDLRKITEQVACILYSEATSLTYEVADALNWYCIPQMQTEETVSRFIKNLTAALQDVGSMAYSILELYVYTVIGDICQNRACIVAPYAGKCDFVVIDGRLPDFYNHKQFLEEYNTLTRKLIS